MALFNNRDEFRRKAGTRSNTGLRVSAGDSPATQFVVDKNLPTLFEYPWGGPGQKDVVIAKGMVVSVLPDAVKQFDTNAKRNILTLGGLDGTPIGVAAFNFTRNVDDVLTGNQPTVWNKDYIQLPLLRNAQDAALVKWGAVYGSIVAGDNLVVSDDAANYGKMMKYIAGTHDASEIIGQVWETEFDQTPFGWMQWVMWDDAAAKQDVAGFANNQYGLPGDNGYAHGVQGFDREAYMNGKYAEANGYMGKYSTHNGQGIPGLTDGGARANTVWTKTVTVAGAVPAETVVVVTLDYKNITAESVAITLGGVALEDEDFSVALSTGLVTVTIPDEDADPRALVVTYKASFAGTPVGFDYLGSVGALKIVLKR
jgi:hypothetical protein